MLEGKAKFTFLKKGKGFDGLEGAEVLFQVQKVNEESKVERVFVPEDLPRRTLSAYCGRENVDVLTYEEIIQVLEETLDRKGARDTVCYTNTDTKNLEEFAASLRNYGFQTKTIIFD